MEQTLPLSEMLPLSVLTPDVRNARRHSEENIARIAEALAEVGAARSVVIDETGRVLAGNATLEAAQRIGLPTVRVIDGDGQTLIAVRRVNLTESEKTRLALWDNRAAELAAWDGAVLAALLEDSNNLESGADLAPLWTEDQLTALLGQAEPAGGPQNGKASLTTDERFAAEVLSSQSAGPAETSQIETSQIETSGALREQPPPTEFPVYDETLPTQYRCPRCAYVWSGQPR